jgi:PAS domain S-box-containing protein
VRTASSLRIKNGSVVPQFDLSLCEERRSRKSGSSTTKQGQGVLKLAAILCAGLIFALAPKTVSAEETRRVLVFYEQGVATSAVALVDGQIRDVLEKQSRYHIDLYTEFMDTNLFPDPASQQRLGEWYIQKYQDHQPDVIIAAGPTAIQFMIESHNKYFKNVPVVICCSFQAPTDDLKGDPDFTGTWLVPQPAKTLDAALQLQPDTKQVFVVTGSLLLDRQAEAIIRRSLQKYEEKLQFTYLSNLTMTAVLTQVRNTPSHTIILFGSVTRDAAGRSFISATQSLPMVIADANAPVYVFSDTLVGQGSVGGDVVSYGQQGRIAAETTMRVLRGVKARDIPLVEGTNVYLFDWRALKRWGLKEGALPAGSVVLNRQPTLWEAYGRYISGGILLLLVESLLILLLLRQRAKQRAIEEHLREREARLGEAQGIAKCGSWVWDPVHGKTHWSDEMYRILGLAPQSVPAGGHLIHTKNDAFHAARMRTAFDAGQAYRAEYSIVRPDGEIRIVVESGQPKYDSQQRPVSMIGTLLDITEARRAEELFRESEERFHLMADVTPIMMWTAGVDKRCTDVNQGWLRFTGRTIERELGEGWIEGVHPEDLQKCVSTYEEAFRERMPFTIEYRLRRYDGEYHWISNAGSPRFLSDGTFAGYIGCCVDIHDRKEVELARLELAGRLMNAQELERARIARELHDGIGQQIALLNIRMQRVATSISQEQGPIYSGMQKLSSDLAAIGNDVSHLSHQLHSSELEYLGLTAAITGLCRRFSEEYPIQVACECKGIPAGLENKIALTILRVAQESLHNVAKHSNAKTARLELSCVAPELVLVVCDNGDGFDVQKDRTNAGLGLISMRERVVLVGGQFVIDSKPGIGTTVMARVPLSGNSSQSFQ